MENFDFEHFIPNPNKPGYVIHDRFCTYDEFYEALKAHLKSIPYKHWGEDCTLYDTLDYMLIHERDKANQEIPDFRWIYCWPTRGGCEGFYFHIEVCKQTGNPIPSPAPIMLAKTLSENVELALLINTEINRFIIETLDK